MNYEFLKSFLKLSSIIILKVPGIIKNLFEFLQDFPKNSLENNLKKCLKKILKFRKNPR